MHYRLYGLHPGTGRIVQGRDIIATSDDEAIAAGHGLHPQAPFEIWCQSRRVFSSPVGETSQARNGSVRS